MSLSTAMPPAAATKPTVVLVHGAFADSSSWNGVIALLKTNGYSVIAAANPLRSLHADAEYLRSVLDNVNGPIVIAGHSYGGTVMSEAADGNPHVKALVYVASFSPEEGESTGELAAKFPGNELGPALNAVPFANDDGHTQPLHPAGQVPGRLRRRRPPRCHRADGRHPLAAGALEEKATRTAWKTIPTWNLLTVQDLAVPAQSQRFMADRANSHTIEIDASHAVTVSQPGAVARLIDEAARATTQ